MKTTPRTLINTLKTLTLASAAGLMTFETNTPRLDAAEWWPNGTGHVVNSIKSYDRVVVDSAEITVTTGGILYSNSVIDVGCMSNTGVINVEGTGKISADGMLLQRGSSLIISDAGSVEISNYNLEVDSGHYGYIEVIGSNASLLAGSIRGPEIGYIKLPGIGANLLIDGGTVIANGLESDGTPGGRVRIVNGGMFKAYDEDPYGASANMSGLTVTLGLGTGYVWRAPIVIDSNVTLQGIPQLELDSAGEVFAGGTSFTIMEAFEGVNYSLFGTVIEEPTTHQLFDVSGDGYTVVLTAQAIPEPSTYALIGGMGAVALAMLRRRRG